MTQNGDKSQPRDTDRTASQSESTSVESIRTALEEITKWGSDPAGKSEQYGRFDPWMDDSEMASVESENDKRDRRIYILGVGSVGGFLAHSLRGMLNPPPVTLLFHRDLAFDAWERAGRAIQVRTGDLVDRQPGFQVEKVWDLRSPTDTLPPEAADEEPITNLIVATKAIFTVAALRSVRHRLGPNSTICFMQNGMGIVDEVNEMIFDDPSTRPRYMQGIVSHGLYTPARFEIEHRGSGKIALSIMDVPEVVQNGVNEGGEEARSFRTAEWSDSSRYMTRELTRAHVLSAVGIDPPNLLIAQLEKLAVNCIINPLTAVLGCTNGDLLLNKHIRAVMRLMLAEISLVIRELPEFRAYFPVRPGSEATRKPRSGSRLEDSVQQWVLSRFTTERLEYACISVMKQTAENRSSMLQDVEAGRRSEIQYLNGYIVRRGEELGIKCVLNFMVAQMVEARSLMTSKRGEGRLPSEKWADLSAETKQSMAESFISQDKYD